MFSRKLVRSARDAILVSILLVLASCATNYESSEQRSVRSDDPVEQERVQIADEQAIDKSISNPAVVALLQSAEQQVQNGQYDLASSTLERAIRISPYTAQSHYYLARLRLEQNQPHAALQLALKAQSLLRGNEPEKVTAAFWNLLGDCYTSLGKNFDASAAYANAYL